MRCCKKKFTFAISSLDESLSLFVCSVNLPLHHKVQKFSSGTSLPGWSRKKGRKMVVVVVLNVGHIKPGGVMVRSLDL